MTISPFPLPFNTNKPNTPSRSHKSQHNKNNNKIIFAPSNSQAISNMSKAGKLTKLKSVLRKWNSFSNKHSQVSVISAVANDGGDTSSLLPVYVGRTRRRYLVSADVVGHPLFRELVGRSRDGSKDEDEDTINVACEVVLFEHLLWMLHNADPQPESLDELADFYAC